MFGYAIRSGTGLLHIIQTLIKARGQKLVATVGRRSTYTALAQQLPILIQEP